MSNKLQLVFFGAGPYVESLIQTLHKNFDLQLVVTTEKNATDPVPALCSKLDIPFISISNFTDLQWLDWKLKIENWKLQLAIVASFGLIIPEEIIDIFPKGIVNIHPSFLPYYRGTMPIQEAIKNGDKETAVSIMVIDSEMDHGPLLSQLPLEITTDDTSESLYITAFKLGAEKLVDILPAYVAGNIEPREQDHSKATYTPRHLTKQDGFIDLEQTKQMSSLEIENWKLKIARLIRAYYPWPGVWTIAKIKNKEVRIKLLPQRKLQIEGKNPVSYEDFINGYDEGKSILEKLTLI